MARLTALLVYLVMATGCAAERYAYIECICPKDKPHTHAISLTAPTGKWQSSPHSLFPYESIRKFSIHLPESPPVHAVYPASRLSVFDSTPSPSVKVELIGGQVEVFRDERVVVVSLGTPSGAFLGNGRYPLKWQ